MELGISHCWVLQQPSMDLFGRWRKDSLSAESRRDRPVFPPQRSGRDSNATPSGGISKLLTLLGEGCPENP
jgi:hypothetical protein